MKNKVITKNPNAAVFIYNYKDRLGNKSGAPLAPDQIILNTVSLKSIRTTKSKASPAGSFEITLAPTKNWVTAITPGSWCIILMSNEFIDDSAKYGGGKVDKKTFKMLGRIESVRGVVNTDQVSGALVTEYLVTGVDWGTIFNAKLYTDILNRTPKNIAMGMANRFGYDKYLKDAIGYDDMKLDGEAGDFPGKYLSRPEGDTEQSSTKRVSDFLINGANKEVRKPLEEGVEPEEKQKDSKVKLPTVKLNLAFLLELWGAESGSLLGGKTGILDKAQQAFSLPDKLSEYMGFSGTKISDILKLVTGTLSGDDSYTNDDQSMGIVNFSTILGEHQMWQVLKNNCNEAINELVADIRFEGDTPFMTLYSRVKPFAVNEKDKITADKAIVGDGGGAEESDIVEKFISPYKNLKKVKIETEDVIRCSYGTNWRDRVNFIETNIARGVYTEAHNSENKLKAQFWDANSINRDGLQSLMVSTPFVPIGTEGTEYPLGVIAYKYLLKEWYFNTHKMLNGTLQLIGQDQYIQVGDNILVDAKVVNRNLNINRKQIDSGSQSYLMAHVESISHESNVDENGGRTFFTSINFVRGIITDEGGSIISEENDPGAVDQDASKVNEQEEKDTYTVATSSNNDIDRQKLRGE